MAGGASQLSKGALIRAWRGPLLEGPGSSEREDLELLTQTAEDLFSKVDLTRNGKIEEAEWLHFRLLENQAPSLQALAEVSEVLARRVQGGDTRAVERLLLIFEDCLEDPSSSDARLTSREMGRAVREWLASGISEPDPESRSAGTTIKGRSSISPFQSPRSTRSSQSTRSPRSSEGLPDTPTEVPMFTYFDFLNRLLGRRSVKVYLYLYDLSNGKASWLSPLLLGLRVDGIWHSAVVVHGKEYWFGGRVYESVPGRSQWGEPDRVIELGETMLTVEDAEDFISRELMDEFTSESYDILSHNCNHFSEQVCRFLTSRHIPEDVLRQAERVMESPAAQAARPLLNWWLGRAGNGECCVADMAPSPLQSKVCVHPCSSPRSPKRVVKEALEEKIEKGKLVAHEYQLGWTCIARVVRIGASRGGVEPTYDLKWYDPRGGRVGFLRGIRESEVQVLRTRAHRKTKHRLGSGGMFSACYHPVTLL